MKEQKGITLVALILTVIVLLIIAGVSIKSGTESLDSTRLQGFYTQLEIIQKRVDDIASTNESYIDSSENTVHLKEQGLSYDNFKDTQKSSLQAILDEKGMTTISVDNFKYFTVPDLENILDLSDMDYNVFIDFDNRIIIAEDGITIKGKTYYMLENSVYYPTYDANKNKPVLNTISLASGNYGTNKYKITVKPMYSTSNTADGYIKYKKTTTKYWETSNNLEIVIEELGDYDIIYKDVYENTVTKKVTVAIGTDNKVTVTEITE